MPINIEDLPPSEYLFEEIEEAETPLFTKTVLGEKGHVSEDDIASVLALFENADNPKFSHPGAAGLALLPAVERRLDDVLKQGNLTHTSIRFLKPLLPLSYFLTRKYDAIAAKSPAGQQAFNPLLKQFIGRSFSQSKESLRCFHPERNLAFLQPTGVVSMVTMRSWMFLPTYEALRSSLIANVTTSSLVFIGYNSFPELNSKIAPASSIFCIRNSPLHNYVGTYINLNHAPQTADKNQVFLSDRRTYLVDQQEFKRIPELRYAFSGIGKYEGRI